MDYSILYALVIVIFTLGIVFGVGYLRKIKSININLDDILFVVTVFQLSLEVVYNLNLKSEPQIRKIGEIVEDTLIFIKNNYADDIDLYSLASNYAYGLCDKFGIEITESRKQIISALIDIGLRNM